MLLPDIQLPICDCPVKLVATGVAVVAGLIACGGQEERASCTAGGTLAGGLIGSNEATPGGVLGDGLRVFARPRTSEDELPSAAQKQVRRYESLAGELGAQSARGAYALDESRIALLPMNELPAAIYVFPTSRNWACVVEGLEGIGALPVCAPRLAKGFTWAAISERCSTPGLAVFGLLADDVGALSIETNGSASPAQFGSNAFY